MTGDAKTHPTEHEIQELVDCKSADLTGSTSNPINESKPLPSITNISQEEPVYQPQDFLPEDIQRQSSQRPRASARNGHPPHKESAVALVYRDAPSDALFEGSSVNEINGGTFNQVRGHHTNVTIHINQPHEESEGRDNPRHIHPPPFVSPSPTPNHDIAPQFAPQDVHQSHFPSMAPYEEGPSISTTTYSPESGNKIYERHLGLKRRGFPLWIPEPNRRLPLPYRRIGVNIGDVGIFTPSGVFSFLFNICLPAEHPINPSTLPEGFAPISIDSMDICESFGLKPESYLASKTIEKIHDPSVRGLSFTTSAAEGAILTLPDGALSLDLENVSQCRLYAAANLESWYRYANGPRGREIENGELRLVVGCDKTTSWGMATVANISQHKTHYLKYRSVSDTGGSAAPHAPIPLYKWEYSGLAEARVGPDLQEIAKLKRNDDSDVAVDGKYWNQCLFVRTLNLSLDEGVFAAINRELDAARDVELSNFLNGGGHSTLTGNPSSQAGDSGTQSSMGPSTHRQGSARESLACESEKYSLATGVTTSRSPSVPKSHPADVLNKLLLRKLPHCRVVITQDEDWCAVIKEDDEIMPSSCEIAHRVLATHHIREDGGVAFLERIQPLSYEREGKSAGPEFENTNTEKGKQREATVPLAVSATEDLGTSKISERTLADSALVEAMFSTKIREQGGLSTDSNSASDIQLGDATPSSNVVRSSRWSPRLLSPRLEKKIQESIACYTCRIRRKKCDEKSVGFDGLGPCDTCYRLKLECLGFGGKRPEWLTKSCGSAIRNRIKAHLAALPKKDYPGLSASTEEFLRLSDLEDDDMMYLTDGTSSSVDGSPRELFFDCDHLAAPTVYNLELAKIPLKSYTSESPTTRSSLSKSGGTLYEYIIDGLPEELMPLTINESVSYIYPSDQIPNELLYNSMREYVNNIVKIQYVLGDRNDLPVMIWDTIKIHHDSHEAVKLLARAYYRRQNDIQYSVLQDINVVSTICNIKTSLQLQIQLTSEDAMTALQIVSLHLFDGGRGGWNEYLFFASQYVKAVLEKPKFYGNYPAALEAASPKEQFIIKTTIWFDVLSSVTTLQPPVLLEYIRELFRPARSWVGTPMTYSMLSPMGCENSAVWALAETVELSCWKRRHEALGDLSMPELVKRGQDIAIHLQSGPLPQRPYTDDDTSLRLVASEIFRTSAKLFLKTVVVGDFPHIPEVKDSVLETYNAIMNFPASLANLKSAVVRNTVFGVFICGSMMDDPGMRRMLYNHLLQNSESVGNCTTVCGLLDTIWRERDVGPLNAPVRWREYLNQTLLLLV
ncbi:hypothetical protein BDN70DRAFT_834151 [Pholiota conissans]|uniref:Zn(2)-C6 fungal-type domain-containing protein n=1 Tax=Pholiota conissans TaxID=109636 RepID=A0A9P5Z1T2_9AGAR|nr:hypothetical protein BDN70DRAFT_834151 [Pholiota conissans]